VRAASIAEGFVRIFSSRFDFSKRNRTPVPRPFERATKQTSGAANRHRNVLICEASKREKINGSKRRIHELLVCESCLHAVALPTGFDGFTSLALFSLFPSSLSIDTHTSLTFRRTTIVQIPSKRPTKTHPHNAASHAQDKQPSFGMLPFFV